MLRDPAFIWGVAGILLLAAEFIAPGLVVLFFGLGALATALVTLVLPPVASSVALQGIIFALASILSLRFLRRRFARVFRGESPPPSSVEDLGRTVVVVERITPDEPGRVRYQGTSWKAISYSETFEPGEKAQIVQEENLTLVVTAPFIEE